MEKEPGNQKKEEESVDKEKCFCGEPSVGLVDDPFTDGQKYPACNKHHPNPPGAYRPLGPSLSNAASVSSQWRHDPDYDPDTE